MPKLHQVTRNSYAFRCPGCRIAHVFKTGEVEPAWEFNDDMKKPTINPSLVISPWDKEARCHSFITNGLISFCGDSHHKLAGETVELPEWED